jgi:DNA-directed RNA polymerase subunit N (RpoN/RPB10)
MYLSYKTKTAVLDTLAIDYTCRRVLVAGGESKAISDRRHQIVRD